MATYKITDHVTKAITLLRREVPYDGSKPVYVAGHERLDRNSRLKYKAVSLLVDHQQFSQLPAICSFKNSIPRIRNDFVGLPIRSA